MKRRDFLRGALATSVLSMLPRTGLFAESAASTARPNVLFIFSDQHHAGMTGYAGHPNMRTPAFDRLAAGGMRFDRAYCQDGVCCPSRTSLITGQYPRTTGVLSNGNNSASILSKLTPLQRSFKQAGYYTFTTGKRHVIEPMDTDWDYSAGTQGTPTEYNRDTFHYTAFIKQKGLQKEYDYDWAAEFGVKEGKAAPLCSRLSVLPPEATTEAFAAQQTIQFLKSEQAKKQPFFAWTTFYRPHQPYTPQKKYADKIDLSAIQLPPTLHQNPDELPPGLAAFRKRPNTPWNMGSATEDDFRRFIGYYIALLHEIDDHINSILTVLEQEGLAKNTIIIYSSDHGDFVGNHGLVEKGAMWHNFFEETLRIPFIVNWPDHIPAGVVRQDLVELVDIYPTLSSLCGLAAPSYPLVGRNLTDALLHKAPVGRQYAVSENWGQASIITDRFKYGQWLQSPIPKEDYRSFGNMLMERENDPHELKNLAKDPAYADTLKQMEGFLNEWVAKTEDSGRREAFEKQKSKVPYSKV